MNEFLKILLSLSVSGTLLLLLILGLKLFYKNKLGRRWQYYIWIIVVLRFLLPFTPDTMNVRSLFEMLHTTVITNESPVSPNIPVTINSNDSEPIPQMPKSETIPAGNAAAQKPLDTDACLFFIWSSLAMMLLVRKITIYQGFIRYIKAGNTEVSDVKTLNLLSDFEEKQAVKTRVELYRNSLIASPIMIGFFRPSIVLPTKELEENELSYIFMHELNHYKQRDMFYKWLIQIVICIHWFNPFVYLLEKEVNKACELSCDEAVITMLDERVRREYGDTLISFLKSDNFHEGSFASVTLTEGARQLKERLGAIMNFKKKTKAIRIFTSILTLCIIFAAAFVSVYPVAAADSNSTQASTSPTQEAQKHQTGTYIYDENRNTGWYPQDYDYHYDYDYNYDYNYNYDYDYNYDYKDWDFDFNFDWNDDKAFSDMYAAYGIVKNGKSIYYQDKLIYVFLDHLPDSSFYRLDMNPEGTASIQIIRDKEGKITGVSYMTDEEVAELIGEPFGEQEKIPAISTREWDSSGFLTIEAYYKTDHIYILPSATDKVVLKEYLTENKSDYYASTEIKNNVLTIRGGDRPANPYNSYIEIYVPNNVLSNVKVETVSGSISVEDYTGVVALSATSGQINIFDSYIAGTVTTVSGSIGLYPSNILGDFYVDSYSGEISSAFPTTISYNLKAETTAGKIKGSHFDTQFGNEKEYSASVGNNPNFTITLKTVSANIEMN